MTNEQKALRKGINVESEHMGTYNVLQRYVASRGELPPPQVFFAMIAKDHLKESLVYYEWLDKMESEMKKSAAIYKRRSKTNI